MSDDERAEKGMETIKFKTFHGKTWHLVYLLLGVALPGVLGFIMLGFLLNRTSDFVRLEFGIYDYDTVSSTGRCRWRCMQRRDSHGDVGVCFTLFNRCTHGSRLPGSCRTRTRCCMWRQRWSGCRLPL